MTSWTLALLLAAATVAAPTHAVTGAHGGAPQEPKPVPKDSVEVVATGCLKGRAFTATVPREDGVERGPNVSGRTFRVAGRKDVMKLVKEHNGRLVEVVGIVRRTALAEPPGARVGNTRITVGGSNTMSGRGSMPIANVAVMDLSALRLVSEHCPIR